MLFALASLGLPGLGNFVGEFLILVGAYPVSRAWTIVAALGLIAAAVYALWVVQKAFHGAMDKNTPAMKDLTLRETATLGVMMVAIVWIGLYPQPILNTLKPTVSTLIKTSPVQSTEAPSNAFTFQSSRWLQTKHGDDHAVR